MDRQPRKGETYVNHKGQGDEVNQGVTSMSE